MRLHFSGAIRPGAVFGLDAVDVFFFAGLGFLANGGRGRGLLNFCGGVRLTGDGALGAGWVSKMEPSTNKSDFKVASPVNY